MAVISFFEGTNTEVGVKHVQWEYNCVEIWPLHTQVIYRKGMIVYV